MITPVKYPLAKLLNDKEFKLEPYLKIDDQNPKNLNSNYNPREYQPWYLDLSLAEVVMWLYEKHGIWISIDWTPQNNRDEYPCEVYWYYFISGQVGNPEKTIDNSQTSNINSPTEAYFAAIEYVLLNLI